ncbi:hypothetical protein D9M70_562650 [compost metagenome]
MLGDKGFPGGVDAHARMGVTLFGQVAPEQQLGDAQHGCLGIAVLEGLHQAFGQAGEAQPDFAGLHPVARGDGKSRVGFFG